MNHDARREARRERSQRFVARQLADTYGAAWSPAELRSIAWVHDRRAYAREAAALAVPGTEIRATVYQLSNGSWCWRTEDPGAQRQADVGTCYTEGAARLDAGRAILQRLQDKINDAQRALGDSKPPDDWLTLIYSARMPFADLTFDTIALDPASEALRDDPPRPAERAAVDSDLARGAHGNRAVR